MHTKPGTDLKARIANEPVDQALVEIIYELKGFMTAMWSTMRVLEITDPDQADQVKMLEGYLKEMLGVIDELIIGVFLPRLQRNPDM